MQWFPKLNMRDLLILLGISLVYFATRLYALDSLPIFVDEAIYSRWSQISLYDASWRFISLTDGKQPLFIWVAMPLLYFVSDPLVATRLVSVVCGFLTIAGLWYAGYLLSSKRAGYLAAILGVITPFLFFYDRFAVMESMLSAAGIWVFNLAYLLAKSRRLDLALILGITGGLALLVKSPAQIFILLIPVAYLVLPSVDKRFTRSGLLKYFSLFAVVFVLAQLIYNIQRLSPWMHMINRKTGDFVVSPLTMLSENPYRIWQNFLDTQRWLIAYLTLPIYGLTLLGIYRMFKDLPKLLLVSAWVWLPMMALVSTAMLYRPRYLVFITPFILLYTIYAFPHKTKHRLLVLALLAIIPARFMYLSYVSPLEMPLLQADQDYVSGWAAGNGVKEISTWLVERSQSTGAYLDVYTEGTFGLLPHGLELYVSQRTDKVRITGLYPITQIPPQDVVNNSKENVETYFILNNTQLTSLPPNSEEVLSFKKADESYIRLYRIFP